MTVLRIDNDDGSCRLEIPGANRRWSLILLRVPSFNGFSAYVTPQDGKLDENTPKTSVSDISDLISVRDHGIPEHAPQIRTAIPSIRTP